MSYSAHGCGGIIEGQTETRLIIVNNTSYIFLFVIILTIEIVLKYINNCSVATIVLYVRMTGEHL